MSGRWRGRRATIVLNSGYSEKMFVRLDKLPREHSSHPKFEFIEWWIVERTTLEAPFVGQQDRLPI